MYRFRSAVDRVNSRLSALTNKRTLQGLKATLTQVSHVMLGLLLVAWTAIKSEKPESARSITH
jgi:hypothetical protein